VEGVVFVVPCVVGALVTVGPDPEPNERDNIILYQLKETM